MELEGWYRIGNDEVAYRVSLLALAGYWMPCGVFRLYRHEDEPNVIEGLNCLFFWGEQEVSEPRLVVGRARYVDWDGSGHSEKEWDFDNAWSNAYEAGADKGAAVVSQTDQSHIGRMCVAGTDLYSISSLRQVTDLLAKVRKRFQASDD